MSSSIDFNLQKIKNIFASSHFSLEEDIEKNISIILTDMRLGLETKGKSSLAMLPSYLNPFKTLVRPLKKDEKIIVIDLGGSNLRTCILSFNAEGIFQILDLKTSKITQREYSSVSAFFEKIAEEIERFKGEAVTVAFCFSYAIKFLETGKAIILSLSKGLYVHKIENKDIGDELHQALIKRGWESSYNSSLEFPAKSSIKVFVVNDTIATLYSALTARGNKRSSYVSFILGTGLNAAYIEEDAYLFKGEPNIIVLEAGAFDKIQGSDFDKQVVAESEEGATHLLEKMCSARYMGCLAKKILERLNQDDLISNSFIAFLNKNSMYDNNLWEFFNNFIEQFDKHSKNEFVIDNSKSLVSHQDAITIHYVLDCLIRRSCNISSAIISAICIKNKRRNTKDTPISIAIEGSTILRTHNMLSLLKEKLEEHLLKKHSLYFQIERCENATLIGSAIAVL